MTLKFTEKQLNELRDAWGNLAAIDPCTEKYANLIKFLDRLPQLMLMQLSDAKIKFVSLLAGNRIKKKKP